MPKLTKTTIDTLLPSTYPYIVFDDAVPRFGVRVLVTGKKSYVIQYRSGGRTRRVSFSKHGTMTVDKARVRARELLVSVDLGADPAEEIATERSTPTMASLCERFMDEHVAHRCKPSTAAEYRRSVDLFINPVIGTYRVTDVSRPHIARLHHNLRDKPYQANRTLGVLSKLFNLAEMWGLRPDGSNPCRHVRKYTEEKRERYLTPEELARLGAVLDEAEQDPAESKSAIAALKLLILTGCRKGEIQTLKWEYVQGDVLALPDSKTGAKKIYLGAAALEVLGKIERIDGNPYVITGKIEGEHLTDLERPWRRIRERAGIDNVRIHDLRHSFASSAVGMGESLPMIGKLLGHSQVQTTARYAHLADDPIRVSVARISDEIARKMGGKAEPNPNNRDEAA